VNQFYFRDFTSVTMPIILVNESRLVARRPSIATSDALLCQMTIEIYNDVSVLDIDRTKLRDIRLPFINIKSLFCRIKTRDAKIFLTASFVLLLRMYLEHLPCDVTAI
jgi:hypothetical protein